MNSDTPNSPGWRHSKWPALSELAIVALIFVADEHHFIPVSKTPFLLVLAWVSLRIRGLRWRDVGLSRYRNWRTTLLLGMGGGILLELIELFVSQPLLIRITGKPPDLSDFFAVQGDIKLTAAALALTWTLAAFGEEMVWRAYLMDRVAGLGNHSRVAWAISLVLVNCAFGYAHSYQGITGIIDEAFMGALLGVFYLATDCNLSVSIVAHGVGDTIDVLLLFLGKYPL
jgi:hypothetical protein